MEMAKAASEASSKSTPRSKITMVRHEGTNTPRSLLDEENQNPNSTPQMKRIISSRRSNSIGTDSDASVSIQRARKVEIGPCLPILPGNPIRAENQIHEIST